MKKTAEEKLSDWIVARGYRGVTPEVVESQKLKLGLSDVDIFFSLDEIEKKEVMEDRLLFQKWIELVHCHKYIKSLKHVLRLGDKKDD